MSILQAIDMLLGRFNNVDFMTFLAAAAEIKGVSDIGTLSDFDLLEGLQALLRCDPDDLELRLQRNTPISYYEGSLVGAT